MTHRRCLGAVAQTSLGLQARPQALRTQMPVSAKLFWESTAHLQRNRSHYFEERCSGVAAAKPLQPASKPKPRRRRKHAPRPKVGSPTKATAFGLATAGAITARTRSRNPAWRRAPTTSPRTTTMILPTPSAPRIVVLAARRPLTPLRRLGRRLLRRRLRRRRHHQSHPLAHRRFGMNGKCTVSQWSSLLALLLSPGQRPSASCPELFVAGTSKVRPG